MFVFYFDVSKAFNSVWTNGLFYQLHQSRIKGVFPLGRTTSGIASRMAAVSQSEKLGQSYRLNAVN